MCESSSPGSSREPCWGAIVVAAGEGRRMGGVRKAFQDLAGRPVLRWALEPFLRVRPRPRAIVVAVPADVVTAPPPWLAELPVCLVAGGAERSDSVRAALTALPEEVEVVLVHDAARPFATAALVDRVRRAAAAGPAIPAIPVRDTLKRVRDGQVEATVPRDGVWQAQTPQGFPRALLAELHARPAAAPAPATDDAALAERAGYAVRIVPGEPTNFKLTEPGDWPLAIAWAAACKVGRS